MSVKHFHIEPNHYVHNWKGYAVATLNTVTYVTSYLVCAPFRVHSTCYSAVGRSGCAHHVRHKVVNCPTYVRTYLCTYNQTHIHHDGYIYVRFILHQQTQSDNINDPGVFQVAPTVHQ